MATIIMRDIKFEQEKGSVKAKFLSIFYFDMPNEALLKIGKFKVSEGALEIEGEEGRVSKAFGRVLADGFSRLKSRIGNKRTIYIHQNSGIPLIGSGAFGIVDRGTTLLEVKPITGCNLDCIYCSVDAGKRLVDFVVEQEYLAEEFRKVVEFKCVKGIEAHISSQGEPLLYEPLAALVKSISSTKGVTAVSIDTNATLLTERKVDELIEAGLTRFQISLNATSALVARKMAGAAYDVEKVMRICRYIAGKCDIMINPVLIPGVNEGEIPAVIEFAKSLDRKQAAPIIGIQNFLSYQFGKSPSKGIEMDEFYRKLKFWEKEHKVKLVLGADDFRIRKANQLPTPFKKGDVVKAMIACPGRLPGEAVAVAEGRTISVAQCNQDSGSARIKIERTKHNIFFGTIAGKGF